jgi:hypothetical protein
LRKAFEDSIAVLGESAKQAMMYELTIHAEINFADGSLTVAGLHESLAQLYGKDTADVIIEQVLLKTGLAFSQLETRHD